MKSIITPQSKQIREKGYCYYCGKLTYCFVLEEFKLSGKVIPAHMMSAPTVCDGCSLKREQNKLVKPQTNHNERWDKCGLKPAEFLYSFDRFVDRGDNIKYKTAGLNYCNKPETGLYIYGKRGVGKSHLSVCIAKTLIAQNKNVRYSSLSEIFTQFRDAASFKYSKNEGELKQEYTTCGFLFIDDLGVEKMAEREFEIFYYIIDTAVRNGSKLIISSNLSLADLSKLNDRISSRLAAHCEILKMEGKDWRIK
jgi:DNA replication protein DnaC